MEGTRFDRGSLRSGVQTRRRKDAERSSWGGIIAERGGNAGGVEGPLQVGSSLQRSTHSAEE